MLNFLHFSNVKYGNTVTLQGQIMGNTQWQGRWEFVSNEVITVYNNGDFVGTYITDSQGRFNVSWKAVYGNHNFSAKFDGSEKWYPTSSPSLTISIKEKTQSITTENTKTNKNNLSQTNILNPSLYAINEDGKKSKAINVKTNQKFSVEGYIYKNKIPQKHITYEIYDNVGTSKDGTTNNDGFFKHIFTAKHSNYQVFGQGNEKGSTMIIKACASSNCESVTIHISGNDHTLSTNNEKSIQESESVLKQISTLIEEAQKAEQKTCFLFWCW